MEDYFKKIPLAHAGHSAQPPIGTSGNFPAGVSAESPSNISPNPSDVISEVSELYDKPFLVNIGLIGGEVGVAEFLLLIGIFQFMLLGSPCKNL